MDEVRTFKKPEEELLEALEALSRSDELMRRNRELFREMQRRREEPRHE